MKACWKFTFRMMSLTVGATLVSVCVATWMDFGSDMRAKLLIVGASIAVACLLIAVRVSRSFIRITDKSIVSDCGRYPTPYRFRNLDHCEIRSASVEGKPMSVLVIEMKNGDRESFGVAPSVSDEVLRSTLEQRGVKVVTGGLFVEEPAEPATPPPSEPDARSPQG